MIRCYSVLVLVIATLSLVFQVVLAEEKEDDNFLPEPEARNAVAKGAAKVGKVVLIIVGLVFFAITVVLVCCCCLPCCWLAKKRTRRAQVTAQQKAPQQS